jgi:outer membrane usher protein
LAALAGATGAFDADAGNHPVRAYLPVAINGVPRGQFLVVIRRNDVLVRTADLSSAGVLRLAGGVRESIGGEDYVSLASLAPEVRFEIDIEQLSLSITLPPQLLGRTVMDLSRPEPTGMERGASSSAYLNYAGDWIEGNGVSGVLEGGASFAGGQLQTQLTRLPDGSFVRGQTSLTVDRPARLERWSFGDLYVPGSVLGGSGFMAGVGVSRMFELDPYFVRYPGLSFAGAVTAPSTAEVYVNGSLVSRETLPPGEFDLTNIPAPVGTGEAEVVIRDAFGNEQVLANPFYASSSLLRAGLSEYSYNLGVLRRSLSTESFDYGEPAFSGRHRLGLSDWLTGEARLEATPALVSGGVGAVVRLPLGELEAHLAGSRQEGRGGGAASVSLRRLQRGLSFSVFARQASRDYANLSTALEARPGLRLETGVLGAVSPAPRVTLSLQYSSQQYWGEQAGERRVVLSANLAPFPSADLFLSVGRSRGQGRSSTDALVGLSYFIGGAATALRHERQDGRWSWAANSQKPLPVGSGYGYRVDAVQGADRFDGTGTLQMQGSAGRYEATVTRGPGGEGVRLSASGGLVWIGGRVFATRPVGESFALIQVPGVEGVRGFASNHEVGRTDTRGDLFVPDLLPYYGNRLGIAAADVPQRYDVAATERVAAPPFRGGTVVRFPVALFRAVRGVLVVEGEKGTAAAYGELEVETGEGRVTSPIGGGGEFELDGLPAGSYMGRATWSEGRCLVHLTVPDEKDAIVDVGKAVCRRVQP